MISKERIKELEHYFWNESNDEDTQEWRDELNLEEEKLIESWDDRVNTATKNLCEKMVNKIKK